MLAKPQPQEFLVEIVRLLAGSKALVIGIELPIARRIRRVNFVDQNQAAAGIDTELVFSVDQRQAALRRDVLPARKQLQRRLP